jgi:hypothetical protein
VQEAPHACFVRVAPHWRNDRPGHEPAQCLVPRPAEHVFCRVVPFGDVTVAVDCDIRILRIVDHGLKVMVLRTQHRLGCLAASDFAAQLHVRRAQLGGALRHLIFERGAILALEPLVLLARLDVLDHRDDMQRITVMRSHERDVQLHPQVSTVPAHITLLDRISSDNARHQLTEMLQVLLQILHEGDLLERKR